MSTIAYRERQMASDRMAYTGKGGPIHARKQKTFKHKGKLYGITCSTVGAAHALKEWIKDPDGETQAEAIEAIGDGEFSILVADGKEITIYEDSFYPQTFTADYFAVGNGADYALGAMGAGVGASEAVRIASKFDPFTSHSVDVIEL